MDGIDLFDLSTADVVSKGFSGAVSDGSYLYLVPLNNGQFHGQVVRFNLSGDFDDQAAWERFDTATIDDASKGFVNAVFDGRFIYLVPYCNGKHHGQVTRYDTRQSFQERGSWAVFDTTTVHANSRGFVSGCFDGRYLYLAPYQIDHVTHHGQVTRYDTTGEFADAESWQVFDTASVHPDSRGFHSAVAAGDYVYFIPYLRGARQYSGMMARLDRRLPYTSAEAWQCIDVTGFETGNRGYVGGVFHDGMLYLAPYVDHNDRHGRTLRYNTRMALDDATAWTTFDCATVDTGSRGFFGAVCDGRYLYLIPHCRGVGQYHGQLTRYDVSLPFDDPGSWSICDLARVDQGLRGFIGGVLHGNYLYLAPFETDAGQHSGMVTRVRLNQEELWS